MHITLSSHQYPHLHRLEMPQISMGFRSLGRLLLNHLYTCWLFNHSDLKTIVFPSTAFALLHAYPAKRESMSAEHTLILPLLLRRTLCALLWSWLTLLAFSISHQRQPSALEEDKLNKPWRPMPTGRLTATQARNFMLTAYLLVFAASFILAGGMTQCALLVPLGYLYNDMKGGDRSWILRNIINGLGIMSFASGALEVTLRSTTSLAQASWLAMLCAMIATTVQTQDMYDQEGDAAVGRQTIPLVLGDGTARWTIVAAVFAWSWLCPVIWGLPALGYCAPVILGGWVSARCLAKRDVEADKTTFRIYKVCWSRCTHCH